MSDKDVDNVNHPSHYETGKFECIDVMLETQGLETVLGFCKCNAFKYIYRSNFKGSEREDIEKAIWYLEKYLELSRDGCEDKYIKCECGDGSVILVKDKEDKKVKVPEADIVLKSEGSEAHYNQDGTLMCVKDNLEKIVQDLTKKKMIIPKSDPMEIVGGREERDKHYE